MIFSYDHYNRLRTPKVTLAKLSKEEIGLLYTTKPNGKLRLNDISEMKFTIYSHIDGLPNLFYNEVTTMKLIEIQYIGWFSIAQIEETENGINSYKEVTLKSLECELSTKTVYDINGVFNLYNIGDTSKSLMHIITSEINWKIGHIDNELLTKFRTFAIDSKDIYTLLTSDIAKSFGCILQFDTYAKEINAYDLANLGSDTNIVLSHKNLVLQNVISGDKDNIRTVFRVVGGNDLDIRAVNPTGSNKIINVDYYMTTEYMSQGLIDALNAYKVKYNSAQLIYTTALDQLKVLQEELSVLNNRVPNVDIGESLTDWTKYGLTALNAPLKAQEEVQGTLASAGASNTSDSAYSQYLTAWNTIQAIQAEIVVRTAQVKAKETEITNKETEISNINNTVNMKDNFTLQQWSELQGFLMYEEDYTDTTYVVADTDTAIEALQVKQELYDVASMKLDEVSKPQETIKTDSKNIFALAEHSDIQADFSLGNFITIMYRDDLYTTLRLLEIEIDFADITKLGLTFSNKNKLDSCMIQQAEILNQAKSTSNSLSFSKLGYDKAASLTSPVQEFMNSSLNATTNQVISGVNKEVTFGAFGLRCREWLEDQQKYDRHEAWWNNNTLLFSDDNFKSSKTGIGLWDDGNGNEYYGVIADVIVGRFILSSKLSIQNDNSSVILNENGASFVNCGIQITNGTNSIKLNSENGLEFINSTGTVVDMDIATGNFTLTGGLLKSGNYIVNTSGMSIDLTNSVIDSKNFKVDAEGKINAKNGRFKGKIIASSFIGGDIQSDNYYFRDDDYNPIIDETTGKPKLTGKGTYIELDTGVATFSGEYIYKWLEESIPTTHSAYIKLENGRLRITDTTDTQNTLFYSHEGISTTTDANNASGVLDFRSHLYNSASEGSEYKGITIKTKNSPVALMSAGNSVIINPRSDSSTSLFDFDTSVVSNFGRLRFGNRTFTTEDDGITYAKQLECGLLFDNTESAQAIYATDGEGTKDGLIDFHAKNIYAESINGGNVSKPLTELSITSSSIVETNADGSNTYTITRNANGVITKVTDSDGNTITITIS